MIEKIKKYWRSILVCAILAIGSLFVIRGQQERIVTLEREKSTLVQNIGVLNDTIHSYKGKNDEQIFTISAFQSRVGELEVYSKELSDKIESYKKTVKNTPTTAISATTETSLPARDTVYIINETSFDKDFDFSDKYRSLTGWVSVRDSAAQVHLNPETIFADITTGIDENNNVFVMTDNPYIKINSLVGYTMPKPKKKHWGLGIHAGYGIGLQSLRPEPFIGVGISYNIFNF